MAVTCLELGDKRKLKLGIHVAATTEWIISGTNDETAAMNALNSNAPAFITWDISTSGWITWTGQLVDMAVDQISDVLWRGVASYADPTANTKAQPIGASQFDFEIGGGTQKIFQAVGGISGETIYAASGVPAMGANGFNGAIGAMSADEVQGVEVQAPQNRWSITWVFAPATVDPATTSFLSNITYVANNPVNNGNWYGYSAGEVLFLGCTGRRRSKEKYELNYRFAASPNVTNYVPAPGISVTAKQGWQYLWMRYGQGKDATANVRLSVPKYAVVDTVYNQSDFTLLGIGSTMPSML